MKIDKNNIFTKLALIILFGILGICIGCSTDGNGIKYMGFDDDTPAYRGVFGTNTTKITGRQDIYVAPNTTLEITKTTRRKPSFIDTIYYDKNLKRYVGISKSGRKYLLDNTNNGFMITETDSLRVTGGRKTPGRVHQRYSSSSTTDDYGTYIKIK